MAHLYFSIIITALNPGKRLADTLKSVLEQTCGSYEVIIKDGGSTDGSLRMLPGGTWEVAVPGGEGKALTDGRIRILRKKDRGIYDGMNQALPLVCGKYVLFLNCGDRLYDRQVLERVAEAIRQSGGMPGSTGHTGGEDRTGIGETVSGQETRNGGKRPRIYYGDQYNELQRSRVHSAPRLDDLACYRNVPCHQVCFYDARLFGQRGYDTDYRVRADYEHFLWCLYDGDAEAVYIPVTVASYEGGGFSETGENRRRSALEHRAITRSYMGRAKCIFFRLVMLATLAPLRTRIAEDPRLSKGYNRLKSAVYGLLRRKGGNRA